MSNPVETLGLTRRYGNIGAVEELNLTVRPGEVAGSIIYRAVVPVVPRASPT
ncbi:MAG: hypothetical protein ACRDSE_07260 [Pseudonocardiaceae bacterium]